MHFPYVTSFCFPKRVKRVNVFLLQREGKEGLGRAYIAAFQWAFHHDYDAVVTMDCDFSHDPKELPFMVEKLSQTNCVIGSRYTGGIRIINWPIYRLILSYSASIYIRWVLGLPILDPTGGFNCYRVSTLKKIPMDKIFSNGYCFQAEIKYRIWLAEKSFLEHPIIFSERCHGQSKMAVNIISEGVINILKLRLLSLFKLLV